MVISSSYFGSVALWEAIGLQGEITVEANENFQKQSFRSQSKIITASGVRTLSVPTVHCSGRKIPIKDVLIDYATPWQREHIRTIVAAYASAPYYDHFIGKIEPLFRGKERFLFDLNLSTFETVKNILKLDFTLGFTQQYCAEPLILVPPREQYYQVFSDRQPFAANLSILDAIFCLGTLPSAE